MEYLGVYIFFSVFILVYIIARVIAFSNQKIEKANKQFVERESRANSVRRQDISKLDYIAIPYDSLPLDVPNDSPFITYVNDIKELADKRILDLSAYTNTDLKLMYGPANLDELTICDNNYTTLIRSLDKIGNGYIELGDTDSAMKILEYSVEIGSDITSTYVSLGNIYAELHLTDKLKSLIKSADKIKSITGPNIKAKLKAIQSNSHKDN